MKSALYNSWHKLPTKVLIGIILLTITLQCHAQIKLIARADDMGSFQAANLAIIDSYKNGIVRTVEVMAPCPWFDEAAEMLKSNPGVDVGLHLVLNSEWFYYRWKPLTNGKTLHDRQGYFNQMVWGDGISSLSNVKLDMDEVEAEFRAQIKYALEKMPQISHLSEHMYFGSLRPELSGLIQKLADEYHFAVESDLDKRNVKHFEFPTGTDFESRKAIFIERLNALPNGTYHFLAHPCIQNEELSQLTFDGKPSDMGLERIIDHELLTDPDILNIIKTRGIELVSYKDILTD
jgi:predicted glycoside hydrolase/deacetylase ChbG (UPF0249 family)